LEWQSRTQTPADIQQHAGEFELVKKKSPGSRLTLYAMAAMTTGHGRSSTAALRINMLETAI